MAEKVPSFITLGDSILSGTDFLWAPNSLMLTLEKDEAKSKETFRFWNLYK